MRRKISTHVDGGSSVRRPGSEDPHRREWKFTTGPDGRPGWRNQNLIHPLNAMIGQNQLFSDSFLDLQVGAKSMSTSVVAAGSPTYMADFVKRKSIQWCQHLKLKASQS